MDQELVSRIAATAKSDLQLPDEQLPTIERYVKRAISRILVFCGREDFPPPLEDVAAQIVEDMLRADQVAPSENDVASVIKVYDRPTALFYLDPPYVNTEKYYDSPFSAQDHHRLREVLSQVKGRFILSYNDHPLIRELYADYRIEGITRTTTLAGKGNNQTQYAELIIRNF